MNSEMPDIFITSEATSPQVVRPGLLAVHPVLEAGTLRQAAGITTVRVADILMVPEAGFRRAARARPMDVSALRATTAAILTLA